MRRSEHASPLGHVVLVDFFGTLVEIDRDVRRTWQVLVDLGYRSSPEVEHAFSPESYNGGRTPSGDDYELWLRNLHATHARAAGVPEERVVDVVDLVAQNDRAWTVRATSGAEAFVGQLLEDGHEVVVCSNWDYDLSPYLAQAALPDLPAVCSWEVGIRKPDPQIVECALGLVGGSAGDASFVGDDLACDMLAAIRAGVAPVWFRGRPDHPLVANGVVSVLESLERWT